MIKDHKILCKEISKENEIDLNLLLSIHNTIFTEIYDWTKNPDSLKIYLKHFGSWFFKKHKTKLKLDVFEKVLKNGSITSDETFQRVNTQIKNYNFILSEYDKYTKERYEIKCKKYGKEAYEAYCMAKKQKKIQQT